MNELLFVACSSDGDPVATVVVDVGTPFVDAGVDAAGPTHVPSKIKPACHNAGLVIAAAQPRGIQGTTAAAKIKSLQPFEVHFEETEGGGTNTLVSGTNTSNVSWHFTIEPKAL